MECAINWILNIFTDKRASKSDLNGTLALATTSVFLMERVHVRSGLEQICGNRNFIGIGCQMQFNERSITICAGSVFDLSEELFGLYIT